MGSALPPLPSQPRGVPWPTHEGQHIVLCPYSDLIIVRHGATPTKTQPAVKAWLRDLAAEFG